MQESLKKMIQWQLLVMLKPFFTLLQWYSFFTFKHLYQPKQRCRNNKVNHSTTRLRVICSWSLIKVTKVLEFPQPRFPFLKSLVYSLHPLVELGKVEMRHIVMLATHSVED